MCDQHGEDRQAGTWWFLLNDRKITVKELDSPFRWFECRKCKLVPCKVDTLCSGVTSNIKETENSSSWPSKASRSKSPTCLTASSA